MAKLQLNSIKSTVVSINYYRQLKNQSIYFSTMVRKVRLTRLFFNQFFQYLHVNELPSDGDARYVNKLGIAFVYIGKIRGWVAITFFA